MYNVEIGTLFKLLGYRHTNKEYATTDVVIPDIVRYSGRYYKEKDYDLFIENIKSTLKKNHVTPLYCYKENDINHVVCIVNLDRRVFIVDTNYEEDIVYIPIDELKEYMKDNEYYSIQIFYGASEEEPDIELPPKREASGRVVGIGPAMSSNKEERLVRIRKLKDGEENPRKRARTEGGRKYTRRRR
jgi:glycosyltransferase involved in cell wall biosynthesis